MAGRNWRRQDPNRNGVPDELRMAFRTEVERLDGLDDPIAVVRQAGDLIAGLDDEAEAIAAVRLNAVAMLREQDWSYDRIAEATGLSKARVAQLSQRARATSRN